MFFTAIFLLCLCMAAIAACNLTVARCSVYTHDSLDALPNAYCALVLGTAKWLPGNRENQYYLNRIRAAAQVYHSGKCRKILVSGDNRSASYNEPRFMRQDLLRLGVKDADIVCDFAGIRTLDSVIRFKQVFGQKSGIVISQRFHNSRAIYVARHHGIDLVGYNAKDVSRYSGSKTKLRELLSRFFCVLDVHVLHTRPRHLGEPVKI